MSESEPTIRERVAEILAEWPDDEAERAAIRARLPVGMTKQSGIQQWLRSRQTGSYGSNRNMVTQAFQRALWALERDGCIVRRELVVVISNRDRLRQVASGEGSIRGVSGGGGGG